MDFCDIKPEGVKSPPLRIAEEEIDFEEGIMPFSVLCWGIPPRDGDPDILKFAIWVR